jgi:hypothetical protein
MACAGDEPVSLFAVEKPLGTEMLVEAFTPQIATSKLPAVAAGEKLVETLLLPLMLLLFVCTKAAAALVELSGINTGKVI